MSKAAKNRDQDFVAGNDHGRQASFDPGPCGTIDQQGPMVFGPEYLAIQHHDFVHIGCELWIELA